MNRRIFSYIVALLTFAFSLFINAAWQILLVPTYALQTSRIALFIKALLSAIIVFSVFLLLLVGVIRCVCGRKSVPFQN